MLFISYTGASIRNVPTFSCSWFTTALQWGAFLGATQIQMHTLSSDIAGLCSDLNLNSFQLQQK